MILLFDENIPARVAAVVAAVVAALGVDGAHHVTEHLDRGTADADIFAWLEGRDWLYVTQDQHIAKRQHEIAAIRSNRIGGFVLVGKNDRTVEQMASFVIECLPRMRARANEARPFLYSISPKKEFTALVSAEPRRRRRP